MSRLFYSRKKFLATLKSSAIIRLFICVYKGENEYAFRHASKASFLPAIDGARFDCARFLFRFNFKSRTPSGKNLHRRRRIAARHCLSRPARFARFSLVLHAGRRFALHGYGFTNFTTEDGLPHRRASDFLETSKGVYLVATGAGIARLNPHGLRGSRENSLFTVYLPDNPKAKRFNVLYEDGGGQTWAGSSDGLYKLNETGGEFQLEFVPLGESLREQGGVYVERIVKDRRGALWVGTQMSGLFRLQPDGKIERFTTANGLPNNSGRRIIALGTRHSNLARLNEKVGFREGSRVGTAFVEDRSGNLWYCEG